LKVSPGQLLVYHPAGGLPPSGAHDDLASPVAPRVPPS
jgi:hypothetical protein